MAIQMSAADRHLYTASSNFTTSNVPYSISVWINATWNGGARLSFVGMYDGGLVTPTPTTGLQIGTSTGAGEVSCWTYGGTVLVQSAGAAMTPYNGTWVLLTYTFDGTNHRIYRNETLLNTSSSVPPVAGTFTQIYINGYPPTGSTSETASYAVDAYAYYSRTLSIDEITTIYNARGTRHGIVYGLLARYDFDELAQGATVTGAIDVSGNGNTILNSGAGTAITYTFTNTLANANLRMVQ
jgi:hypothetical protein